MSFSITTKSSGWSGTEIPNSQEEKERDAPSPSRSPVPSGKEDLTAAGGGMNAVRSRPQSAIRRSQRENTTCSPADGGGVSLAEAAIKAASSTQEEEDVYGDDEFEVGARTILMRLRMI